MSKQNWLSWLWSKARIGGVIAFGFWVLSILTGTISNIGAASGEVANLKKLQAEIAPELGQMKSDLKLPTEISPGVTLTEFQVFEAQVKFVYVLDLDDPMAWLDQYSRINGEGSLCPKEAGFGHHLLSHGMTQMQDFHSKTSDGRKVFRQIVRKPFECRGRPGFEFLTARR